jgi:phage FluMu protein Com
MEVLKCDHKIRTMRCVKCLNIMKVKVFKNLSYCGQCPVCKAIIYGKVHSPKEETIKIIKAN